MVHLNVYVYIYYIYIILKPSFKYTKIIKNTYIYIYIFIIYIYIHIYIHIYIYILHEKNQRHCSTMEGKSFTTLIRTSVGFMQCLSARTRPWRSVPVGPHPKPILSEPSPEEKIPMLPGHAGAEVSKNRRGYKTSMAYLEIENCFFLYSADLSSKNVFV